MATLVIERTSELSNRLRNYGVYIDGQKVGTISNGETQQYEVSSGEHTICCKIDWCSSPELKFETTHDIIKIFRVGAYKNSKWLIWIAILFPLFFIFLRYSGVSPGYYRWFYIPLILFGVYLVTFGRKRFLTLSEK